eukprot:1154868-Pelagomonas_calceolata.AAC.1
MTNAGMRPACGHCHKMTNAGMRSACGHCHEMTNAWMRPACGHCHEMTNAGMRPTCGHWQRFRLWTLSQSSKSDNNMCAVIPAIRASWAGYSADAHPCCDGIRSGCTISQPCPHPLQHAPCHSHTLVFYEAVPHHNCALISCKGEPLTATPSFSFGVYHVIATPSFPLRVYHIIATPSFSIKRTTLQPHPRML